MTTRLFNPGMRALDAGPPYAFSREFQQWLQSLINWATMREVSVSFGGTPLTAGSFTITDATIRAGGTMVVMPDPTDEENALEPVEIVGVTCADGSATVEWQSGCGNGTGYDAAGELVGHSLGGADGTRSFLYRVSV